jgi:hypothetical protein
VSVSARAEASPQQGDLPNVDIDAPWSRVVDLNLLRVRLSSNLPEFDGFSYFSRFLADDQPVDYEIVCIDLAHSDVDPAALEPVIDRSFRGKRFRSGFYLVHHFGAPAYLITRGRRFYVFGRALEKTVWPYFVKHILTVFSLDHGFLHLKAGGFVQSNGSATLLVGRNGGGKTVFLTQACLAGAEFLTNTHVLVRDGVAHGVPSAIRVRDDPCFGDLIRRHALRRHIESGDYVATPQELFPSRTTDSAAIANLVVVDFHPNVPFEFEEVSPAAMAAFLEQFSFAVSAYGLKDDVFAHCGSDFTRYTASYLAMKSSLDELVRASRCIRVSADMLDPVIRQHTLDRLDR